MPYTYDNENVFARILTGDIPSDTVLETEHSLAFRDIQPQAPTHVLVIPKGAYVNFDHFASEASEDEIVDFVRTVSLVAAEAGVTPEESGNGYRLISNAGRDGEQEVPHLHVHVLAGRILGRMLRPT